MTKYIFEHFYAKTGNTIANLSKKRVKDSKCPTG
jgi:hypothetical protein